MIIHNEVTNSYEHENGPEYKRLIVWRQKPSRRTIVISPKGVDSQPKNYFVSLPATYLFIGIREFQDFATAIKIYAGCSCDEWNEKLPGSMYVPPLPNIDYTGYVCLGYSQCHESHERTPESLAKEVADEFFSVPFKLGEIDSGWADHLNCDGSQEYFFSFMDLRQKKTLADPNWSYPLENLPVVYSTDFIRKAVTS